MSDLRYLSQDHPPLTTECSGPEAIGQRILTLLFAPNDNTRSVGGDCFSLLKGGSSNHESIQQLLQVGLSDIMPTINAEVEGRVTAEVTDITAQADRVTVSLSVTVAGETIQISTTI